jgi:hypothetical protein
MVIQLSSMQRFCFNTSFTRISKCVFNSEISVTKLHNLFDSCHLQLSENIKIVPCYLIDTVNKKDNKTQSITGNNIYKPKL